MAGGTRPFTIDTWQHMIDRCANPKARGWNRYGGRGIRVCERWMVFENFHTDIMTKLGPRPEGHTLDRIDNNGNYEPDNVRWATAKQQANNRRSNRAKEVQL